MKLICASDLHGTLFDVPEGDLLLLAGDLVPLTCQTNMTKSGYWFRDRFYNWAMNAPVKKVVFIGGNHDFWLESNLWNLDNDKVKYLHGGQMIEVDGLNIYGFPYIRRFGNWAFPASEEMYTQMTPADILLSHDTPSVIGGTFSEEQQKKYGCVPGNEALAEQVHKYRYCFCGHWHEGNHEKTSYQGCEIYNVSLPNDQYMMVNRPLTINI